MLSPCVFPLSFPLPSLPSLPQTSILLLDTSDRISSSHHTNELLAVWKSGMAALQPSQLVTTLAASTLESIRAAHKAAFGQFAPLKFAVVHVSADSAIDPTGTDADSVSTGSGVSQLLRVLKATVNASDTLLFVSLGHTQNKEQALRRINAAFHIVTRDELLKAVRQQHPEREMSAAVEQAVARESLLFVGSSSSPFSRLTTRMRCFAASPLTNQLRRASVLFDRSAGVAACHADG